MPGAKKNFIGLEGFIWWIGVVEDRQDPEQLGRVRVRCFGWHTEDKEKIPTDQLPWAHPVIPVNSPNAYTPKEGDMVFGFFVDGTNAQNPAIMGVLPGKPEKKPDYAKGFSDPGKNLGSRPKKPDDSAEAYPKAKYLREQTTNRLSRGKPEGTIIATRKKNLKKGVKSAGGVTWSEPPPPFKPTYPYNNALETESGHALEFDDTPGQERVHLAHKKGAYIEFDKDGSKLERVQKDNYTVIMGDDFIYVKGKAVITVDGNFNLKTSTINIEASEINMSSDGAVKIKGSSVKIESTGGMDLKAGGAGKFTSGGKLSLKGATAALAGATVDIPAAKIGLQSGSAASASGSGLKGGGTAPSAEEREEAANTVSAANSTKANTAASANSVGTSASASSAAAGIDPKANPNNQLEEVKVTGKKVDVSNTATKTTFGKLVDGISSTVSGVVKAIGGAADSIIKDFASSASIGELSSKIETFAGSVNDSKGLILGLKTNLKNGLLDKIDQVATGAIERNIDFDVDSTITNAINEFKYAGLAAIDVKLGKHIYPRTETVEITNIPEPILEEVPVETTTEPTEENIFELPEDLLPEEPQSSQEQTGE